MSTRAHTRSRAARDGEEEVDDGQGSGSEGEGGEEGEDGAEAAGGAAGGVSARARTRSRGARGHEEEVEGEECSGGEDETDEEGEEGEDGAEVTGATDAEVAADDDEELDIWGWLGRQKEAEEGKDMGAATSQGDGAGDGGSGGIGSPGCSDDADDDDDFGSDDEAWEPEELDMVEAAVEETLGW